MKLILLSILVVIQHKQISYNVLQTKQRLEVCFKFCALIKAHEFEYATIGLSVITAMTKKPNLALKQLRHLYNTNFHNHNRTTTQPDFLISPNFPSSLFHGLREERKLPCLWLMKKKSKLN